MSDDVRYTLSGPAQPRRANLAALVAAGGLRAHEGGRTTLLGPSLDILCRFEAEFEALAARHGCAPRRYPTLLPTSVLGKTDYYTSFPQHATFAVALRREKADLLGFVGDLKAGAAAPDAAGPRCDAPTHALPSAVCYHCYDELEGQEVPAGGLKLTAQGRCFRFEHGEFSPLQRQWEFSMRELVRVGSEAQVRAFRDGLMAEVVGLATRYGFRGQVVPANDPFFGVVEGRARNLMQKAKALKYELRVEVDEDGGDLAIASFNLHEDYFGRTFGITQGGAPCWTGCVAFGVERWVAAYVAHHGHRSLEAAAK